VLQARGLSVEVGGRLTLEEASFTVRAGDTAGLVGRNGAGKTSLLRVLGGEAPAAAGTVVRTGGLGYLPQDPRTGPELAGRRALDHVLSGRGLDELVVRMEKLRLRLEEEPSGSAIDRHARAVDAFEHAGGWAGEAEARRIAAGLGLTQGRLDLPLGVLSGGERRRVELSRILFAGSDVLLLDEPTNHLDVDAKEWLMAFLRSYRGALLVISHDLELLDDAITRVLHLDRETEEATGTLVAYNGTYSQYVRAREEDESRQAKVAVRQAKEIQRLSTLADSMRGQTAKRARVAKSLDGRVERLERSRVEAPKKKRVLNVRLPVPPPADRTVIEANGLWKAYGALDVFSDVTFDVGRNERVLVLGLNGAGKTTLLQVLAGRIQADLGDVRTGPRTHLGYFAQEHEGIVAGRSLVEHLREESPLGDEALRGLIGMFGLSGDKAFQDAATLSGGEKTKLALAQLVAGKHNLLLLDEPTNNLDPMSRTAIGEALSGWPGTMIVVSHDVEFVRALAPDRVVMMPEGQVDHFSEEMIDLVELA
jgi:ATPase subunit of ABC transporter with duplicated ATPase domains